jgi:hypothetical protein
MGEGGGEVRGPVVVGDAGVGFVVEGPQPRGSGGHGELGQGLKRWAPVALAQTAVGAAVAARGGTRVGALIVHNGWLGVLSVAVLLCIALDLDPRHRSFVNAARSGHPVCSRPPTTDGDAREGEETIAADGVTPLIELWADPRRGA